MDEHRCRVCVAGTKSPDPYAYFQCVHADIMKNGDVGILNHLHNNLTLSNLGSQTYAITVSESINLLFGGIYVDWLKRILGMHSICG